METTKKTNTTDRELTTTEIQIAIAQIYDRLIRIANAQSDLGKCLDREEEAWGEDYENRRKDKEDRLRIEYGIPSTVFLFDGRDEGITKKTALRCRKYIEAFVRGRLTEDTFYGLIFYFQECAECDYGWIMLEKPMGFYGLDDEDTEDAEDAEDITEEMFFIGTRSQKKTKLKNLSCLFTPLTSAFSHNL